MYLYILCWSLMAIYTSSKILNPSSRFMGCKIIPCYGRLFSFHQVFQSWLFFLSSRRLMILICMYDIHTMLTCTHMSQIVTHVTIWKYRMINKIYLRSLYMEPYFVISWFSLIIRSCIIDFLYKWIITQDQIFNF